MRALRRVLGTLLASTAAALAPAAARAETGAPFAWPPAVESGSNAPMRLGLRAETWRAGEAQPSLQPGANGQCRRWRAMAQSLGESYAGYALRTSVVRRVCDGPLSERVDDAWDWPWAGLVHGRLVPPRLHQTFGPWQIRCGAAGTRQRCAAVHVAPLSGGLAAATDGRTVVTHFVIDMVAGRESVLWRMFVPSLAAEADTANDRPGARLAGPVPMREDPRVIRYALGEETFRERYAACAPKGCIMEAALARGSRVATRLWDGASVELEVSLSADQTVLATLPERGFRAALRELVRLRQEEMRGPRR